MSVSKSALWLSVLMAFFVLIASSAGLFLERVYPFLAFTGIWTRYSQSGRDRRTFL